MDALRREAISKLNAAKPPSSSSLSQNLHDILKKAQYNKKSVFSDSESEAENKVPTFDCSGGLRLSGGSDDSESEQDEKPQPKPKVKATQKKTAELVSSGNEESGKPAMDLKAIHDNLERMKHDREKLSKYSAFNLSNEKTGTDDNVADLLLMGENAKKIGASQKRKKASQGDDSDSDNWEDVEGKRKRSKTNSSVPSYVRFLKRFEYDE